MNIVIIGAGLSAAIAETNPDLGVALLSNFTPFFAIGETLAAYEMVGYVDSWHKARAQP
jgi:hypothetical protein